MKKPLGLITIFSVLAGHLSFSQCTSYTIGITNSGSALGCGTRTLSTTTGVGNAWTQKANYPSTARAYAVGLSIGNKGYMGMGFTSSTNTYFNDFWEYDPVNDAWSQKSNFGGTGRQGAVGFSIGNKGYVGTGYDVTGTFRNDIWEYDPGTNVWTPKAAFGGNGRYLAVGFSLGTKGYIGTGSGGPSNTYADFWEYDPIANSWASKALLTGGARLGATSFTIGTKAYVGSGQLNFNGLSDFWEFDPTANSWTQKTSLTTPLYGATSWAIGSKGYLTGGYQTSPILNASDKLWQFDPVGNTWNQLVNAAYSRFYAAGFVINGKGYIGTGSDIVSNPLNNFYEYEPLNTFQWSTGATTQTIAALVSGTYNVLVTSAAGCTASASQVLALSPNPTITISGSTITCSGTSNTLVASGASSYTWSSNAGGVVSASTVITPTTSAFYTVSATSGTCTVDKGFLLNVNSTPQATIAASGPTLGCGILTLTVNGTENVWTQKTSMTFGKTVAVGFSIGSKGYVGTGCAGGSNCWATDFWEYDPATNSWTQKANFPGLARVGAVGFSIGSKGYLGTGSIGYPYTALGDFWEYDPVLNTWTQKANFGGGAREFAAGFSVGGKGYIGTGRVGYLGAYKKDLWEYNPATNAWIQKSDFIASRYAAVAFSIGNKAYLGKGTNSGYFYDDFYEYDPATNNWTTKASFTLAATHLVGFSIGNKGYMGTGELPVGSSNEFWQYDPGLNTWKKLSFPGIPRSRAIGFVIGSKGYLGLGSSESGIDNELWEFNSDVNIAWSTGSTLQAIPVSSSGNYSVNITAGNGCYSSASQSVALSPNPTITVTGANALCIGESRTLTASGANSFTWSANAAAGNATVAVVTPTATSTYTLSGTSGTCTVDYPVSLTVNTLPVLTVSASSSTVCDGNTVTLNATGATTYTWTNNVNNNTAFTPTATSVFSVTGASAGNCTSTTAVTVTVKPSPTVSVNNGSICAGQSFTIIPNGGASYVYSGGSAVVSPAATSAYTVTGTNTVGCSRDVVSTVTVHALPVVSAASGAICIGNSFTITPTGAATYTYSNGSAVVTPTAHNSYTVSGTSSVGCVGTVSAVVDVTVNSLPVVSVNGGTVCNGQNFTITPNGASTYSYSPGGSSIVSPSANTSYSVTGTSSAGCVSAAPAVANLTVLVSPTVSVNSGSICAGQNFTMVPSGGNSYVYSGGASVVSPNSTTSYTVTGFNAIGCPNPGTIVSTVTVHALPVVAASNGTICSGNSYTISPSGAATYTYSSGSSVVSPPSNASYTVSGTSSVGCVGTTSAIVNVTVNPLPVVSVSGGTICTGNSFTLSPTGANSYTIAPGGSGIISPNTNTSYTVTGTSAAGCIGASPAIANITVFSLPVITAPNGTICVGKTFTITPAGAVTYTYSGGSATVSPFSNTNYTVSGTNNQGCVSANAATVSITVNPLPVIAASNGTICSGNSFTIVPTGASTYSYSSGSNIVSPITSTSYTITGLSSLGCYSTTVVNLSVQSQLTVTINGPTVTCEGQTITLSAGGAATYTWNTNTVGNTLTTNPSATTVYSVNAVNGACAGSASTTVLVNPKPVLSFTSAPVICVGETTTLNIGGATSYTWSEGTVASSIVITPTLASLHTYTVLGTSANGCLGGAVTTQSVSDCLGITELSSATFITVYPNPNNGIVNLETNSLPANATVNVYNYIGELVLSEKINGTSKQLDYKNAAIGLYTLKIIANNKCLFVAKMVKE